MGLPIECPDVASHEVCRDCAVWNGDKCLAPVEPLPPVSPVAPRLARDSDGLPVVQPQRHEAKLARGK